MQTSLVVVRDRVGLAGAVVPTWLPVAAQAPTEQSRFSASAPSRGARARRHPHRVGAECGMLSVPLDYRRPSGEKIQIAVSAWCTPCPTTSTRASCSSTRADPAARA